YQYLQTLPQLAQSQGSTFWVIPSEVTSALRSISKAFGGEEPAAEATEARRIGPLNGSGEGRAGRARPRGRQGRVGSCHYRWMEKVRVDRWLWAVRLTKTRSGAAQACRAGHVQVNGGRAKPGSTVKAEDTVRVRVGDRQRVVEVVRPIEHRVGAELAAACLIDKRPPPPPRDPLDRPGRRDPGMGRPTKRDRRQLDRTRGRRV